MRKLASLAPMAEAASRVLVVDDSPERRALVAAALRKDGYEVRALGTLEGVIDTVESFEPDLALLASSDAIDGVGLCGELRAREAGRHTPIIVVGVDHSEDAVAHALLAGADDYLSNPDRVVELSARVRVQLRTKRMLDALTRLRAERDNFRREATHDPLTGLLNRRALEDAVARHVSRGEPCAVLFIDIDHFKNINDTYGHGIGDVVLRATAQRMIQAVRPNDVCARYGGEEFVLLVSRATEPVAYAVARRHRSNIESMRFERTAQSSYPEKVTVSIGVAVFDVGAPDKSAEGLLRRADAALYEAKRNGRNCVVMAKHVVVSTRPARPVRPLDRDSTPSLRVADERPSLRAIEGLQQPALPRTTAEPEIAESRTMPRAVSVRAASPSTQPPPPNVSTPPVGDLAAVEVELRRRLETRRTALPNLPDVTTAALRLAGDPNANVKSLVALVEKSPPIAARFLAIANSAIYSRGVKVTSIHVAVVRLGLGGARDVMFQLSYEAQTAGLKRHRDAVKRSFERSVIAAHVCRAASHKLGLRTEYDYLAGLLHDIGESYVYRVLDSMTEQPSDEQVADLIHRYHTDAGAEVARAWHLPEEIAEVCAKHHDEAPAGPLLRLVMVSDLVVTALERANPTFDEAQLESLGVDEALVVSLLEVARQASKSL